MRPISIPVPALVSLSLLAALATSARAQKPGPDGWVPFAPIEREDEPWAGVLEPRIGPERDGKPTEALRWPVALRPGPDSPALIADWSGVESLRFRLYLDKPHPYRMNLLLTGSPGGYMMTDIPLDFAGWRQITVPIADFKTVRTGDLATSRFLSFRLQGYGQPALDPEMVWWLDEIEVKPKPGVTLALSSDLENNLEAWRALEKEGNPLLVLNARQYAKPIGEFTPPPPVTNAWQYRGLAEQLVGVAYAAADPKSPHRGRADLVKYAVALADYIVGAENEEGWWWRKGPITGDPNTNRFTLGPLLDGVRWLRMLPEGEAAWPRWKTKLDAAVDLQRRAYERKVDWDWGGLATGEYANQDAYYVLILALSAELFDRPADRDLAAKMMKAIASNQLPDGGIHYIAIENEAPVYHALNVVILGRYATLTKDPTALSLLKKTANYWPLVMTAEGQPEYWSDVWWKQSWGYVWPEGMMVSAGATRDPRHQWLLQRVLERTPPVPGGMDRIYAAPYWTGLAPGTPMPADFVVPDRNMRGIRGRSGAWYFGVTQGRGLRNTFVGGLVTGAKTRRPLRAAFRGAQIEVLQDAGKPHGLWLSQINDRTGIAYRPGRAGALGARYTLQPSLINGVPTPETPPTPWQVTQIWRAAGDGVLGTVTVEATADAPAAAVIGRIALGPGVVEEQGKGVWTVGPLAVRFYRQFGSLSVQPIPGYNQSREQAWQGIEMRQSLQSGAKKGDRWTYTVWVGPKGSSAPVRVTEFGKDAGWMAVWPDGRRSGVAFNPGAAPATVRVPSKDARLQGWDERGTARKDLRATGGAIGLSLKPVQCILLESR